MSETFATRAPSQGFINVVVVVIIMSLVARIFFLLLLLLRPDRRSLSFKLQIFFIIIIIIVFVVTFMQGICNCIPEKKNMFLGYIDMQLFCIYNLCQM